MLYITRPENDRGTVHFAGSLENLVSNMNSYIVVSCLLAFVAIASANPPATLSYLPLATIENIPNPSYGFNYAVNDPATGDNKAQWETRNGDVVQGAYSLVEPDGNVRVVEYTADSLRGFNAVVKRTGPNVHSVGLAAAPAVIAPIAPIAPIAHAPIAAIDPEPIVHSPIITPVIDTAPIIAPYDVYPILPPLEPWVHLSGATYGHKGNIVRRWTAGPISLAGQKLTIRTKH
ncbi:cuticle protein 7-like [Leguminivora glycinivorella]|uniref:cuticle protein 7-like n=1 Tax=Leguminivora glycinivorella TaxID=1035111 RepID=UPI00200C9DEA|nr:cuticle protein 7-like [Leguminivora glycinivorella]